MTAVLIPQLERPAFFDGQRLEASDLGAVFDFLRDIRWLHNQTLHGWGIAYGFTVSGAKGDRVVTIAPGYALDSSGHDVVLGQLATLQIPPVAAAANGGPAFYYLTASYLADEALPTSETRDGVCLSEGAVRRSEEPLLRWQDPKDVSVPSLRYRRGTDIVLASIYVKGCVLAQDPSPAERRDLHEATQPYVAAGATPGGSTAWSAWSASGTLVGATVAVDTSSSAFGVTPTYSAQVAGSRVLDSSTLVDGFPSVTQATPTGFVLQMLLPRNMKIGTYTLNPDAIFGAGLASTLQTTLGWYVAWMGVEG